MLVTIASPLYWHIFRHQKVTFRKEISVNFRNTTNDKVRHFKHTTNTSAVTDGIWVLVNHASWEKPERSYYQDPTGRKLYNLPSLLPSGSDTVLNYANSHANVRNV